MTSCIASGKRRFWAPARCTSDGRPLDDRLVCGYLMSVDSVVN